MQNSGKLSPIRANGGSQEWGRKRRKAEDRKGKGARRAAAIRDARNDGATRGGHG